MVLPLLATVLTVPSVIEKVGSRAAGVAVTTIALLAKLVQPAAITCTVYVPEVAATMLWVVSPVLQR
jgi:hypothetical protein